MSRASGRGWAYGGVALGLTTSIIANVAHTFVPPVDAPVGWSTQRGAVFGAVFWPLAVFVTMETQARVAWPPGWRSTMIRHSGMLTVALVAAVVSYRHMSGLLAFYGEDRLTCVIGPIAIDGLMVMATSAVFATRRADEHADREARTDAHAKRRVPEAVDIELLAMTHQFAGELVAEGVKISRRNLSHRLRTRGHAVSNTRAGELLRLLADA